jgi:hypothetical protein
MGLCSHWRSRETASLHISKKTGLLLIGQKSKGLFDLLQCFRGVRFDKDLRDFGVSFSFGTLLEDYQTGGLGVILQLFLGNLLQEPTI